MVVGFTTTCAISAYYHYCCEFGENIVKMRLVSSKKKPNIVGWFGL
jgi:hypothetical protein